MRLVVATPLSIVIDADDVESVRAEDKTGAFGILPGHADFLTILSVSVISWRDGKNEEHHVAVRGGILTVRDGKVVEIATRDAVGEDTLSRLGSAVIERFHRDTESEKEARTSAKRLEMEAIRYMQNYLEAGRMRVARGPRPPSGAPDEQLDLKGR